MTAKYNPRSYIFLKIIFLLTRSKKRSKIKEKAGGKKLNVSIQNKCNRRIKGSRLQRHQNKRRATNKPKRHAKDKKRRDDRN